MRPSQQLGHSFLSFRVSGHCASIVDECVPRGWGCAYLAPVHGPVISQDRTANIRSRSRFTSGMTGKGGGQGRVKVRFDLLRPSKKVALHADDNADDVDALVIE